jgi:hypothetical protein
MKPTHAILPAALLLLAGCATAPGDRERKVYAPREEGLTLSFENPSLEGQARAESRLQLRIEGARPLAGPGDVTGTIRRTRLSGEEMLGFEVKDGGLRITDAQDRTLVILPEGFPDRVGTWGDKDKDEVVFRVLGRGTRSEFGKLLPRGTEPVGIWVEGLPAPGKGTRTRSFLLPNVGTAELLEYRNGAWVPVLRLMGRGFTDTPAAPPVPKPPVKPAPRALSPRSPKA